jgi:hypothetical protein
MTKRLEQAVAEVSKLSRTEQDALADWLLAELESERQWEKSAPFKYQLTVSRKPSVVVGC